MTRPSVAIVGRPNVGKSTLFNALVRARIAIEAPHAGTTRDRVLTPLNIDDRIVDLVDTGGIGVSDRRDIAEGVERQIAAAMEAASILIFVVDAKVGVTNEDAIIARRLRRLGKPVILAANKVDTDAAAAFSPDFRALGLGEALEISAKHRRNLPELEEAILRHLPPQDNTAGEEKDALKIAIVGRRNVGKSSLVNALCGAERVIVSDLPGTTRDTIDVVVERGGERFIVIDTAGLRRRGQTAEVADFFSQIRSERAILRADVVFLLLNATAEISRVEKQLGARIVEAGKPCVIGLNKWDLARAKKPAIALRDYEEYVAENLPGLWFCPLAALSAKTGENVWPLIQFAKRLWQRAGCRVGTGVLNMALSEAQKKRRPKPKHGKISRIMYATQTGVFPPTFLMFATDPKAIDSQYQRYLAGYLREVLPFAHIPLRFIFRASPRKRRRQRRLSLEPVE